MTAFMNSLRASIRSGSSGEKAASRRRSGERRSRGQERNGRSSAEPTGGQARQQQTAPKRTSMGEDPDTTENGW
jgi:hypothetical protein